MNDVLDERAAALLRALPDSLRESYGQSNPPQIPMPTVPKPEGPLIDAAVLVPISRGRTGFDVILTRRTDHLNSHPGQISFPGGRMETHDESLVHTALRETAEEIGVRPEQVAVLGSLNRLYTPSGFDIQPFVGQLSGTAQFAADPHEVAEIMRVPLRYLIDRRNYQRRHRQFGSSTIEYLAIDFDGREIWGATARILIDLVERLEQNDTSRCLLVSFLSD